MKKFFLAGLIVLVAGALAPTSYSAPDTDGDGLTDTEETINKVVVWGDTNAPVNVPTDVIAPKAVAAGGKHALALLYDGSVKAWGDNSAGQCNVPESPTNVLAIAAGAEHSLALLSNGRVAQWGWGDNNWPNSAAGDGAVMSVYQNCLVKDWDDDLLMPHAGLEMRASCVVANISPENIQDNNLIQVRFPGGRNQGVFDAYERTESWDANIQSDYTVFSRPGQYIDVGQNNTFYLFSSQTNGVQKGYATAVAAGDAAGTLDFNAVEVVAPAGVPLGSVSIEGATAIAAGDYHSLAILSNGTVTAWGTNDFGQCDVPASVTNAISISANRRFSAAVLQDGSVVVWGGGLRE